MKKLLEKKTAYTSVNLRVFVSKSEVFCSCPLLAQTAFLTIALECKIPLWNPRDVLPSATDLIHNIDDYILSNSHNILQIKFDKQHSKPRSQSILEDRHSLRGENIMTQPYSDS